jgi:ParB-like chromosome segregation protein Spo0J
MSKKQPRLVPISELVNNFYVRIGLDNNHVRFLQGLREHGVVLEPIEIAKGTNEIIDGRHRVAVELNLGHTEIYCNEEVYSSKEAMIIAALKANVGGSLPPSPQDIVHTIECLLHEGLSRKVIISQVSERVGFPPKLVARYIDDVRSKVAKRRKAEAVTAIAGGDITLVDAAEKYSVNIEELKAEISGKPKEESGDDAKIIMARLSDKFR